MSQSSGVHNFPVTITAIGTIVYRAYPNAADASQAGMTVPSAGDRSAYVLEVPIARKFSSKFSAQITPVFVHRNAVNKGFENNDDYALGFAARYKVTRSFSLIGEYYSRMNAHANTPYYNSAGMGFDIETGGHVFQVVFTNSMGLNTRTVITETAGNIQNGDVRFGFNITRTFQLTKRK
jgi:hypothetical protein